MTVVAGTKIALVAEELSARPDEGVLKVLDRFSRFLSDRHELKAFYTRGEAPAGIPTVQLPFTRAGISGPLRRALKEFAPGLVYYAPSASITLNAMWRARLLRAAAGAPVVLIGLQKREYGFMARFAMRLLRPDVLVVTSREVARRFEELGWSVVVARVGVDLEIFRPLSAKERDEARSELGWNERRVLLHVGHLRKNRGLSVLSELARDPRNRVVFVASVSERGEEDLEGGLVAAGVEVHRKFIPHIERFYQAADAYVFPVAHRSSAIDFPLSVLEALACGLPTLSTRYGALPEFFDGAGGFRFFDPSEDVNVAVDTLISSGDDPSGMAREFGWDSVFDDLTRRVEAMLQ